MKNVLIISYSFPPLNNIASRRFGEMVEYMEQFGWRPYIITTQCQGTLPLSISEDQCIRIGTHPQANNRIDDMDITINKLPGLLEFSRNVLGRINFRFRSVDRTLLTWGKKVKGQKDIILHKLPRIDLVIASFGPASSLWLGQWFANCYAVPWIADFRDLAALRRDNRSWLAYNMDCIFECYLLRTCSGMITVSRHLTSILADKYGKKCEVIYNGWNNQLDSCSDRPYIEENYIYYAGRFYDHRMKAVYALLEALTWIKSIRFKIRSLGPVELEKKIIAYAIDLGIKGRVELLPSCSPKIVQEEAQHAIANVVVEDMDESNPWAAGTLTGKFLQLLPGNVPIMSIARPDNEMSDILEHSQRGRLCSSVDEIKAFIIDTKTDPGRFNGNKDSINEFSKKKQTEKLCSFFDMICR